MAGSKWTPPDKNGRADNNGRALSIGNMCGARKSAGFGKGWEGLTSLGEDSEGVYNWLWGEREEVRPEGRFWIERAFPAPNGDNKGPSWDNKSQLYLNHG